jgi:hypothetical protein
MFNPYKYSQRPFINDTRRISISQIMRSFFLELERQEGKKLNIRVKTEHDAELIKNHINDYSYNFECFAVPKHDTLIEVDYVRSNLCAGYVFYFVCKCESRVRHLYQVGEGGMLMCRNCLKLRYKRINNKYSQIRRLIRNPDLLINYLSSTPRHYEVAENALNYLIGLKNQGVL